MFDYRKEFQLYRKYYLQNFYNRPTTQVSLGLLLSLILICIFTLFALKPTLTTIAALDKEINTRREYNTNLQNKISALSKAQAAYVKVRDSIFYVDNSLPKEAAFPRLEREIELFAVNHNIILTNAFFTKFDLVGVQPKAGPEKQYRLAFQLSLEGSFNDLKGFLQDMEKVDRVIVIDQISFSNKASIEGAQLSCQVGGWTSYLPIESYKITK